MKTNYEMVSVRDFGKVQLGRGAAGKTSKYPWSDLVPNGPGFFVAVEKPPRCPISLIRAGRRFSVLKATYKNKKGFFVTRKGS